MRVDKVPVQGICAAGEANKLLLATVKLPRPVGPSQPCASSQALGGRTGESGTERTKRYRLRHILGTVGAVLGHGQAKKQKIRAG